MPTSSLAGLSLRDLEYAVAVADLRHFGRAAERCRVSQAGLSEQVRKLEALLGTSLFERSARRFDVTPEGEGLLQQARQILEAARQLLETAQQRAEPLEGPLRLGVIPTLGPYYIPSLLREIRAAFPQLQLKLVESQTLSLLDALRAKEIDAVLLAVPVGATDITSAALFFEPFRAVLPIGHPLADRPHLQLADLAGERLLLLEEGHCLRDQALSLCGAFEAEGATRFASSLEMLRHMIAADEGHSLMPLLATEGRMDLEGLVLHRELEEEVGRTIGLAWRVGDPREAAFNQLARFLRSVPPAGTQIRPEE
jgi:LysR family hydrogen peroxide-inducible transcriptional activator